MELDLRTKTAIQALVEQRNNAMDTIANLAGELAELQKQLADLKNQHETPSVEVKPESKKGK